MANGKPGLLLFAPNMEAMCAPIADRFDVLRLWQEAEPAEAILARGAHVIAIFTSGQDRVDTALMEQLPNLRLITAIGAGFDGIDVAAAGKRGITVANAGETHSADVADQAVALALCLVQRIVPNDRWVREGTWEKQGYPPLRRAASAERFGILGLGHIGRQIAHRLQPFGGEIAWWSRSHQSVPWPRLESPLALAKWCTTLIVAVRGDVTGLVDAAMIEAVGLDGYIVNVARGRVIDENAMIEALREGRLGGAGLDVFATEPTPAARWATVPNVILSPHVGAQTFEAMSRLRDAAIRNLRTVLEGGPVVNAVTL